jgi:hypothetical protein
MKLRDQKGLDAVLDAFKTAQAEHEKRVATRQEAAADLEVVRESEADVILGVRDAARHEKEIGQAQAKLDAAANAEQRASAVLAGLGFALRR